MIAPRHRTILAVTALALAALVAAPGCIVTQKRHTSYSGAYFTHNEVSQIEIGESTPEDAELVLGPPSSVIEQEDGSEVWTWKYTKTTKGRGSLLFVFGGSNEKTVNELLKVRFVEGVAVRKWRP